MFDQTLGEVNRLMVYIVGIRQLHLRLGEYLWLIQPENTKIANNNFLWLPAKKAVS